MGMKSSLSPPAKAGGDRLLERSNVLALLAVLTMFTGCSRDDALSTKIVTGDAARAEIVRRAQRQNSPEFSLPDSAANFYLYDAGNFNGLITYWSLECTTVDDCWLALGQLGGPDPSAFDNWRPSELAVVMEGPGYYSPDEKTDLWDVRSIERGKIYEHVRGRRQSGNADVLEFYAIDLDRRRIFYHGESGGFPTTAFPRP